MAGILDKNGPTPEEEFADEIAAYEKEETEKASKAEQEAAAEPEPEVDEDVEEVEAKSDDDEEVSAESESEGEEEAEAEESQADSRKGRQVPLTALQAERSKTAALQRQFDEMNGQMRTLMQMYQPPQDASQEPQQDISPDPEEDPIGAIAWTKRQMETIRQAQEQQTAQQTRTAQEQKLAEICNRNTSEFVKDTPDYLDAYQHLMQSRISELRLQGLDDESIGSTIRGEEQALAISSLQQNVNPAARVYDLAKARGYTGKPQSNPTAKFDPDIEDRKKSASLNTGRGNPPKSGVTPEDLAKMDGAKFDASWEKVFGKSNKSFV